MTKTERITHNGQAAIKVTCECKSHKGFGNAAIITGPAAVGIDALKGRTRDERIHGFVLMANHPAKMMQAANAKKGVFPA